MTVHERPEALAVAAREVVPRRAPPDGAAPAERLVQLIEALNAAGAAYCYWRSGLRVGRALSGQSDLDLLFARGERERASAILRSLGFKRFADPAWRDHPAVQSFLGHDEASGAIVFVHAHFRLVAGHALLKSFRLPIEEALIARSFAQASVGLKVLDPIDEALLLVARASLETRYDDPLYWRRRAALRARRAADAASLAQRIEGGALAARARTLFSPELAGAIEAAFRDGGAVDPPFRLKRAVAAELAVYRAPGALAGALAAAGRVARYLCVAIAARGLGLPRGLRRPAPGGGVVVAVVGLDGSGKSTLGREMRRWLSGEIDTRAVYFGTGDGKPSLAFLPFKAVSGLIARRIKVKPKGASHGAISDRPPGALYSAAFAVWAIAVALDKRAKLIAAHRAAGRGFVVVTDRYPQNEDPDFNDGPLLHRLTRCPDWLRRLEARIYRAAEIAPPDLVIKLMVGPQTVARREPDMNPDVIRRRVARFSGLTFGGARVVEIDAARPLEEVVATARRAIWDLL